MKKFLAMLCTAAILVSGGGVAQASNNSNNKADKNITAVKGKTIDIDNIDWNKVEEFDNQFDLVDYLKTVAMDLETVVPVVLTNGYQMNLDDVRFLALIWHAKTRTYPSDDPQTTRIVFFIEYKPGERVTYAYLCNDTSFLTAEEMQLYNEAVKIVDEAYDFADGHSNEDLYLELYIHDVIAERATYYTETPIPYKARFSTAMGALIDGKANCGGYADAFYMLGNMCSLDVENISANNYDYSSSHAFNIITLNGKNYFVDVTWDDELFSSTTGKENNYAFFNTSDDIVSVSWQWSREYFPTIVKHPDKNFYYYTKEFERSGEQHFGTNAPTAEGALDLIAEQFSKGRRIGRACAPYDERYKDKNVAMRYVLDQLPRKYGWHGSISMNVYCVGNYMFFASEGARTN